ncbi:hypothetical protein TNCV_625951 [Trichonephila clavipes]|nr:hypothetical protein TNCV_625951 [Trichonephila clavipes]
MANDRIRASDEVYMFNVDLEKALQFPKLFTSVAYYMRNLHVYNLGSLCHNLKANESFMTARAGSDVVQSRRPIFDDFFQHLWPYIGNNTANVVFQMVKRLWLIRIDQ